MKRTLCLLFAAIVLASRADAQLPGAAGGQTIGLAAALQRAYNGIKQNLTEATDKLSDADYAYGPSPEIRPYGGQFGHLANFLYLFCSAVKGEANPNQGQDLDKKATKAEFVKGLEQFPLGRSGNSAGVAQISAIFREIGTTTNPKPL